MSKTRNLSDLLDANGDVKSTALDNVPASNDASALTTGTLPDGRFPATLPAVSGANLTNIPGVPSGVIAMWSGASNAIPSGWVICDGNNSTPNLTDKFIKASGTAGTTGGSTTSGATTLSTSQMPSHSHDYRRFIGGSSSDRVIAGQVGPSTQEAGDIFSTGGGGSHTHSVEPPYYTLIFIMKT